MEFLRSSRKDFSTGKIITGITKENRANIRVFINYMPIMKHIINFVGRQQKFLYGNNCHFIYLFQNYVFNIAMLYIQKIVKTAKTFIFKIKSKF